jgi:gliding motility-associated-like protein/uncharacterized repeat protein (TIGR01451 family)
MNKSATFPLTLGLLLGRIKLLIISLFLFGLSLNAAQVFAQTPLKQATGGTGKYRNSIYWFDFAGLNLNAGETKNYQFTANGIAITVVIDQLNQRVAGYRSGTYVDDRMDDLYNIGGLQGANTLVNCIANTAAGASTFRVRAYATYNGQPASIGLVFGNGEADRFDAEYTQGITNGEDWRLLEAGVFSNTTERQITFSNNNKTVRLQCLNNVALLYSQKTATSSSNPLTINGTVYTEGGRTAMALGVITYSERGDAPESYGTAGHLITPSITGGVNPGSGTGNVVYIAAPPSGGQLISAGTVAPALTPKLGALSGDFDPSSFTNLGMNADADDLNGQNDEDGVTTFKPLLANATSYSVDAIVGNTSGSPAYLVGWIDFNRNGTFEESEGVASTVPNGATTATLNWTGLSNLTVGQTYARFRISTSPSLTVANPGDAVDNGEAEDYTLTILEPVEICNNGIDDDGNGLADCDDPACNPYVNYFANGSMENYSQCPNLSQAGTMAYVASWKTSLPAPAQTGGQLMVNDPANGCVSPRPAESWLASTNLPAGSDGVAWAGMHGGTPNLGFEDFQNTLIAPLPAGTYTFTFSAGYLVNAPYTAPGYFKFYGVMPGEADFTMAHPLGDSPMINNAISASDPTWKDYSFTFTSTAIYDRIYMVAYSGPAGRSYLVFDGFKMVYNPPVIGFQNPLETCIPDAILKVNNPDPVWVSYQWYMDGVLIPGATEATYQPTTGQLGVFTVSGILASGCASAPSAGITLGSNCPVAFECNGSAYLVTTPDGTTPSTIRIVDPANPNTLRATLTPSIADVYNAIGYNFEDNLIYGLTNGSSPSLNPGDIVRIDGEGTVTRLGAPTAVAGQAPGFAVWTTNAAVNANGAIVNLAPGVVGLNNKFYGLVTTSVATNRYLVTVDLTTMTYTTVKLSGNYIPADLAFSPYDGMLYGLAGNVLIRTNPNNGNQQAVTVASGTLPANVGAGGAWNDVQGRVYFYANGGTPAEGGGRLYRYNPANGAFVNVVAVTPYPGFDATACFPTRLEKKVIMPAGGLKPGDVVEFEFSIYNGQMLPMTYDFEDVLTSTDLTWVNASVNPASPGGGTVIVAGNTLRINGITVAPISSTGGLPLTFRVSLKVADNAAYNTCYTNQATIKTGNITVSSDNPDTEVLNDPTGFCLNPCDVPSPISGGNQQACVADLNGGKLTATATVPTGTQIIWYDAPTGGNVVADPSLSTAGTITYYAAADDGACVSSRTPVTLSITASPVLDEIEDVASCGPYTLPEIKGTDLSGNAAYYTEANGAGTKYVAGDQLSALGTTTLYVYDESGRVENCAGSLSVVPNTTYPKSDFDQVANQNTVVQYTGAINPAFWSGTGAQNINYNAADPIVDGQTYPAILGKINIADTDNCFGTDVAISADLSLTNNGPNPGAYGIGYVAIINTATNTRLFQGGLPLVSPVGGTIQGHVEGVVPIADILAGNISFMIVIETYHSGPKNWTLSNFKTGYSFLPEVAENCFDETSFNLTINEIPQLTITDPAAVCLPGTVDITAAAVTNGSTAGLTFSYFTDSLAASPLANPESIAVSGIYYIKGTNAATGCSAIAPVEVTLIGQPELKVGQPFCLNGQGSIEVLSPLGAEFEYSIDGITYQADPLFGAVAAGTYQVTARNTVTNCVSQATEATIDPAPQTPAPQVIQPDCAVATGTIIVAQYTGATYSIDGGTTFGTSNVFTDLAPGNYSVMIRDNAGCDSDPLTVTINVPPAAPVAPISGGDQMVCAENPVQTLTATASVAGGATLVWYDAPAGGNVVTSPTLNTIGTITYYAEATSGSCSSATRTPVTLTIQSAPHIDPVEDQEACEEYVLPAITGVNLTGNEAYFTAPNGGGERLEPGAVWNTVGTTALYIYDKTETKQNCAGSLSLVNSTKFTEADLDAVYESPHYLISGYDPAFWNGTSINVNYSATDPVINQQTYKTVAGDVTLTGGPECFGNTVRITTAVTLTNNGPREGLGYSARLAIINNATNKQVSAVYLTATAVNESRRMEVSALVPYADVAAGHITVVVIAETSHSRVNKNWTFSDFSANYQFIPETTAACTDEEPFNITIYEEPIAAAGADQTQYNSGAFTLGATTPTIGTGEWTVVSGTPSVAISDITNPNATISLDPNTTVTLRWAVTNGTCTIYDDVVLNYISQADIVTVKVTSEAGKTTYTPGESVDYTITVTNNGPSDAAAVKVVDTAPTGTTITGWTAVVTTGTVTLPNTSGTGNINETIATLPNGAVVTYTVTVQTPSDFTGELVNAVAVTTPTPDPEPECTTCTTPPLTPDPQADIVTVKVTSEAGKTTYTPGESVDYTITVTNNGPSDAASVNVSDTAPTGTTITNWTAAVTTGTVTLPNVNGTGDINETIPTLPNGAVVTYTVTVQTPSEFTGELVNAVAVTTPTPDPEPECTTCITPPLDPEPKADIVTVKVTSEAGKTTYTPGESVDYTITVTNNGPSDATAVNVADTAPAGTTITGWTAAVTTGTVTLPNTSGTGNINETIATLPNGAVVTYTVTVQTPSDFNGELVNAVAVTTPTPDPEPECTTCTTPPLTPDPQADIVTVKVTSEAGKTTYTPGESVDYTITVTNNGPSDATAVNVADTAPTGTTITGWTAAVTTGTVTLPNTSGTGNINETIATLPNGAVVTYTVTVQTPSDFTGELVNAVAVTTPTPDPEPECTTCTTPPLTPDPQADIVTVKVTSEAGKTTYTPGESVDYTITVTNNGPSDATAVNVADTAPAGTTITNWTAAVTTGTVTLPNTSGTGNINETIATLPNGAVVTYTVTVQTPSDFTGELVNAVAVTTPTPDPEPECTTCTTPPLTPDPQADIVTVKVTSEAGKTTYTPGESVDYTITVTNNGPSDAASVNVSDTAPTGTTITGWTAVVTTGTVTLPNTSGTGNINETIATLPNGAVVTYTVTVQTPSDFTGELVNAVAVTTPTEDPEPECTTCTTPPLTPDPQADIVTVKVVSEAGKTTYTPGESVDYTITVTNNGPSDATAVNVSDTAPAGTTITNWTAVVTTGTVTLPNVNGTGNINETIPTLPNGAVVTYTVTVQTPSDFTGELVNAVAVTTPTPDPEPECTTCTTPPLTPDPQADIVTVKVTSEAGKTTYTPGEAVDYTITVTNNGPSDATAVNVADTAPAGTTITNWTAAVTTGTVTLPNTSGAGNLNETIATLPNGAVVTYTVTVQTPSDFTGELVNAVAVTTPTPDPEPECTTCTTPPLTPDPQADIVTVKVTSEAGKTTYTPGESVDYTITVTNNGPSDATAVNVADTAPTGTTITGWTATVTTGTVTLPNTSGTGNINETIATLPNGAVVTYTVTVQTPSDFNGELVNAVAVTTPTPDPEPECTTCTTPPLTPDPQADIVTVKVTSEAGKTTYTPGESVDYIITVTNNGPSDATAVNVADTAPAGTTITNWTAAVTTGTVTLPNTSGAGNLNETIAALPNGAVVTYTVTVQTPSDFTGELVNAVAVTTPTPDPEPECTTCTTPPLTPDPQADIVTVKVTSEAGKTTYTPGEAVDYTITVTNNGPSDAASVNVSDTAPTGTTITNWTAAVTTGTVTLPNTSGAGNLNETIATLPNGAVVTYTVTVQTPSDFTGELVNAVAVTTPTEDPEPECTTCTTPPLTPDPQADIVTVKVTSEAGKTTYTPGESVDYTITVTNNGPSDAASVNVSDTAPTGTTITNWTAAVTTGTVTLPNTSGTGNLNETIATLPNGAVVTYTVTVQTPSDFTGELVNAVAVTTPTEDPEPECTTCTTPPLTPDPQADIVTVKVTSEAGKTTYTPGEAVDYTITVTNNGPSDATAVNVSDTAPTGTTITGWTATVTTGTVTLPNTSGTGNINETIATLPNGAVVTYTVTVQTPSDFTGELVNAVAVTTPTEDPEPECTTCTTPPLTPDPQADIVTVKVVSEAGKTTYTPGESVDYTITVTNNGPSDAASVNVSDTAPTGTTITNWTAAVTTGTVTLPNVNGTGDINETIAALPNGAVVTYTVTVQTPSDFTGELVNAVAVTTPTEDPEPECTTCTTPPLTPDPQADIVTVKVTSEAGKTTYTPGESVDYTITVTNNGPSDATAVNVSDTAPTGTTITNWTAAVTTGTVTLPNTSGTGNINETIATLPNGAVVTYTVTVQTPSDFTGELVNAVAVTTPTEDPEPECTTCTTPPLTPDPQADIVTVKVTSEAGKTTYTPGESVDYTITVTNNGPSDATAVSVADTAPAGTTITNWTAVVTTGTVTLPNTSGTGNLNETIATLPNGAVVTYTVTVQTPSDFNGELVNAVAVTTPTPDPEPECTSCTTPPLTPDPQADIVTVKVTSEAGKTTYTPGESVDYTITVTNNGPSDAASVNVSDTAPAGTTITNWTAAVTTGTVTLPNTSGAGNLNETIATLPNGAVVTYTVTVQTPSDFTGELVNAVAVTTPTPDPEPECTTCTTPPLTPDPQADIVTVKVTSEAGKTTYTPGESVDYTITVTNNGPSDATAVNVADTAPAGTTITNWTAVVTTGTVTLPNTSGTGNLNETIATLPNGAVVTYTVTVQTPSDFTGELVNAVAVTTPTEDPEPECTTCTTPPLTPDPKADIVTVKVMSETGKTMFTPGEAVDYTITVTNNGPSDATAVNVVDTAPAGTTISKWTATVTTGTVTLPNTNGIGNLNETIATLPNGAVVTYTVTVQTPPNFTNNLVNAVVVTTPTEDPEPGCTACETPPLPPNLIRAYSTSKSVVDASGNNRAEAGEELTYTISVENKGNVDLNGLTIADVIPAGTTYVGGSASNGGSLTSNTLNWTVNVPYGETLNVSFKVKVNNNLTGISQIANTATVDDPNDPSNPVPQTPTAPPIETSQRRDYTSSKSVVDADGDGRTKAGEELTYTITVVNTGNVDLDGLQVIDPIPTGTAYVEASASNGGSLNGNAVNWTINVPFGESVSVTFKVKVNDNVSGIEEITNTASIRDPGNSTGTNQDPTSPPVPVQALMPEASDDVRDTESGKPVTIPVLDNDSPGDANLDPSSFEIIEQPLHGTVTRGSDGTLIYTPEPGYTGTDTFKYRVKDENGNWTNVATVTITIKANPLKIPNAITPNGDGKNDLFNIIGLEGYDRAELIIFNRWGNEVYKSDNYKNTWDGQGLNEGTYYYILRLFQGGNDESHKGWILLKRSY